MQILPEIDVMPNLRTDIPIEEVHKIPLPQMCPVSGNPQPGSYITITYRPVDFFLEVYSLQTYINSFVGGKRSKNTFIRDMEQTIQTIKAESELAAQTTVSVFAKIVLQDGQILIIRA